MGTQRKIYILGGGTVAHIRPHLALAAPAYGRTALLIRGYVLRHPDFKMDVEMVLTKMAGGDLETNDDVAKKVEEIVADPLTKIVFMNAALVDFKPQYLFDVSSNSYDACESVGDKYGVRLQSNRYYRIGLEPATGPRDTDGSANRKVINSIRKDRKDIFLVGFKTTCNATKQEQFEAGLRLCKTASCNLVLANDVGTRHNMIITPEEAAYHQTTDREEALKNLVDMAFKRSHLSFTRSTVIAGDSVPWDSPEVPQSLRTVVNHCIDGHAYKAFGGATVGHFAVKLSPTEFLTSKRKTNFNDLAKIGLVRVKTDGPDEVYAYGAKPSVGGQSQRIVFSEHPGFDAIVHFHSPMKSDAPDDIPIKSQRNVECGSHECGKSTSDGLKQFGNLKAVMLDQHGPNIVFPSSIDPTEVIAFIDRNFDLSKKTGGYSL
jgi:hypothetical protein